MIELEHIDRRFGAIQALSDITLSIAAGSFTSLLGPSGCGKSTLLRIIAGLDRPTRGSVRIDGRGVGELSPAERNIAMVFQSYALYPHMSVRQNMTLPLAMRHMSRVERLPLCDRLLGSARRKAAEHAAIVRRTAALLEIEALLERKPAALSGGQKQRVAVGRALVRDPVAFLLDEPLSNLDAKLRLQMRGELVALHRQTGRTFVYVTHDQAEAMSMSDAIAVVIDGRVVQTGTPRELYERPALRAVAAFIGDHPINLVTVAAAADGRLAPPFERYRLAAARLPARVDIGLRPEHLQPCATASPRAAVTRNEYLGGTTMVSLSLAGGASLRALVGGGGEPPEAGATVGVGFDPARAHLFDSATGQRLDARLEPLER